MLRGVPTAPFTSLVTSSGWLAEIEHWAAAQLAVAGLPPVREWQQLRVRPWSTLLRSVGAASQVWLKAPCTAARFEPQLAVLLAEAFPASCAQPIAIEPHRGWLLTADHGASLADADGAAPWPELLELGARLQRASSPHEQAFLNTGLPDHRPATVPGHYDAALGRLAQLPPRDPHRPTDGELDRLTAARSVVDRASERLVASGFAATWQHGDLHPANAARVGAGLRLFDLGDGQWAHPFELLGVPEECLARASAPSFDHAIARYLAAWDCSPRAFAQLRPALRVSYAVNRATTWLDCLAEATPQEWEQWGSAPLEYLRRIPTIRFT